MSDPQRESLQRAYELYQAGQRTEALHIVQQVVFADETNVDAWWLLANLLENPVDKRVAVANVIELNPRHRKARAMLDELVERYPELREKPDVVTPRRVEKRSAQADDPISKEGAGTPSVRFKWGVVVAVLILVVIALALLIGSGALAPFAEFVGMVR